MNEPTLEEIKSSEIIACSLCGKRLYFADSWAPGDEAICSECDTEVTGRQHLPTIPCP
jgi:DNA-directed RNA polymerase subunit RPC12/RpoP